MIFSTPSYDIEEKDLHAALNAVVFESLFPISGGLGIIYLVISIGHVLLLPASLAPVMVSVALVTAGLLFGLRYLLRRKPISVRWSHPLGAFIAGLVLLNSLLHLYFLSDPQQTTNLLLLIIGVGCFFLSVRWLALIIGATVVGWLLIAWQALPSQSWIHFGFALFEAVALSVLVHGVRIKIFRRLEGLRMRDRLRKAELEGALIASDESRRNVEDSKHKLENTVQALQASQTYSQSIISNMLVGLIITDELGVIESVNPAVEKIFGYSHEELIGQHLKLLMPQPGTKKDREQFLKHAYLRSIGRITEWEGRRKSGEIFPFELSLFEFHTLEGRHFAGNIKDVSERREVDRLKKEFISTVSHELRTPLTSIRGSLSLLAAGVLGELPEEAQEVVTIAERNSVRLIGLINDILDLERLESGKLEMHFDVLEMAAILEKSVESVRGLAQQQEIALEVENTETKVYADGDRLVQVMVNLLSNAVKFSPEKSAITVTAEQKDRCVEVRVKDRGRGVPAEHRELIFERFRQVEASDSRQKGGTGLGLAICKAIIEQHNGIIGVESEEGEGSTFWIQIPSDHKSYYEFVQQSDRSSSNLTKERS
jgi:PAS domain S-box-containing protein